MKLDQLKLKLTVVFEPASEGGYTCHFEELPEVFSEGENLEEAKANLLDALAQVLRFPPAERLNASDLLLGLGAEPAQFLVREQPHMPQDEQLHDRRRAAKVIKAVGQLLVALLGQGVEPEIPVVSRALV